jgi:hypothetical protein
MAAGCVLVAAIAGSAGYWRGHNAGEAKVQAAWDRERAQLAEEHAKAMAAAREKEQALQANADQLRQEMSNELKAINQRSASAIDSLRKRADRPPEGSALPGATGAGQGGCTPRELYRQDAEVAVRLAREADELTAALKQCYAQYETLRSK